MIPYSKFHDTLDQIQIKRSGSKSPFHDSVSNMTIIAGHLVFFYFLTKGIIVVLGELLYHRMLQISVAGS